MQTWLSEQTSPSPLAASARRRRLLVVPALVLLCAGACDDASDSAGRNASNGHTPLNSDAAGLDVTDQTTDTSVRDTAGPPADGRPSSYSDPWPLALSSGLAHGFPQEQVTLDCDPAQHQNVSPALLREVSSVIATGMLSGLDIPQQDALGETTCEGDRWNGLTLTVVVEQSTGPFAVESGDELVFHVPSDQLGAWARQPYWNATTQTAHWSPWGDESSEPVPLIGGRVLIAAMAVTPAQRDEVWLQPRLLFAVSDDGDVIAQRDLRGTCRSRLEVDGVVPDNYGPIGDLWLRIAEDALTQAELPRSESVDPAAPWVSAATWVECAN